MAKKKDVKLSVGRGESIGITDPMFNFIDTNNAFIGANGQIYCEYIKNGLHYIYAHFKKDTGELFYIGLGKYNRCNQITKRNKYWVNVFNKHGLIIKLIEVNLSITDAKQLEKHWILKTNPICNMTIGGEAGDNEKTRIPVYCYDKNGLFYKKFNSILGANIFFDKKQNDTRINRCLKGERKSAFGFMWRVDYFKSISKYEKPIAYNTKTVYRYDLNGLFIEELNKINSFKEGSHTGISGCLDKNYTYKNSFWRSYKKDKITCTVPKPALKNAKKVIDCATGKIYNSISSASKSTNNCRSVLERKLKGQSRNNTTFQIL
jgi:hypothetical protein